MWFHLADFPALAFALLDVTQLLLDGLRFGEPGLMLVAFTCSFAVLALMQSIKWSMNPNLFLSNSSSLENQLCCAYNFLPIGLSVHFEKWTDNRSTLLQLYCIANLAQYIVKPWVTLIWCVIARYNFVNMQE